MYHDEIPERCKLNFTGIVDGALRIAGELFPKQTLKKKYIRKEVEIDTDGRVRSRRFEKKRKVAERLKVNSEREQDSPVEMGASNISRFKEMPFLKAKRHRAHSVVSGVRVKDEVEKLAYQLNEEAERTERPIRRLSKVMYGTTCADMQVDVMGECLSSIKHVVGVRSVFLAKRLHAV
ncbi:uncharacterized protein TNCV_3678731 [Trichonephila clavipes]|nr:uncharacterized protein TNCV_3678731 [Trichonephila clavipes]